LSDFSFYLFFRLQAE